MQTLSRPSLSHPVSHYRFLVPMRPVQSIFGLRGIGFTTSDTPTRLVPCAISEDRYRLSDNHKVSLSSLIPGFGSEHFYRSDLNSLIREGTIKPFTTTDRATLDNFRLDTILASSGVKYVIHKLRVPRKFLGISYTRKSDPLHTVVSKVIFSYIPSHPSLNSSRCYPASCTIRLEPIYSSFPTTTLSKSACLSNLLHGDFELLTPTFISF